MLNVEQIAHVCHEANLAYCESIEDFSQVTWDEAPTWQKESAIKGVEFVIANPDAPVSAQHESWFNDKIKDGWIFGPVKDSVSKKHPCLVQYAELPAEQRLKDYLFRGIVKSFMDFIDEEEN